MNIHNKSLLSIALLVSACMSSATTTKLIPRSQSLNTARQLVGWDNPDWGINRKPQDEYYSSMNVVFEYTRTFRDDRLARCLFGNDIICGDCGPSIIISGSARTDRGASDWLADNFGLPRDFKSAVTIKPRIDNFLLDFSWFLGLDNVAHGLYFRIHGPFVHTRWHLNPSEAIQNNGTVPYFQGYFGPHNADYTSKTSSVDVKNLNKSFLDYAHGSTPTLPDDITWQSLCCSKIAPCCDEPLTKNGFGELRFALGWNFLNNDQGDYHLGLGIYVGAPTGNRPGEGCDGDYLFEPIIGNGKHWELGGQITAHHVWWRSEDDEASLGFFFEANIMHLFSSCQTRCFDLCANGENSRYMIAQRLASNEDAECKLDGYSDAQLAFANEFAPVANITQRKVEVGVKIQGDLALSLQYRTGNFAWDFGYNFWARSCEDICIKKDCAPKVSGTWALKGDQRVYGFIGEPTPYEYPYVYPEPYMMMPPEIYVPIAAPFPDADGALAAIPLAATDSKATIHSGSNLKNNVNYAPVEPNAPSNQYADNKILATGLTEYFEIEDKVVTRFIDQAQEGLEANQLYTSNEPITIKECDFDLTGSKGLSHKIFTHLNYAWYDNADERTWVPYLGVGAEVEFGKTDSKCCDPVVGKTTSSCNTDCKTSCSTSKTNCSPCDTKCCSNCAISQWGVWIKLGTSYN